MTYVQIMRDIPGKEATLVFFALIAILAILWTVRFNRVFLGGRFLLPAAWTSTAFYWLPRPLRPLACWWILFFIGPVLLPL
ncbi:hypothetical protein JKG47_20490, partial [Acidithiobacillus sp. MC6.1]|nr:hypothetical protein [Acidithiobacillus sp. MC6.1]